MSSLHVIDESICHAIYDAFLTIFQSRPLFSLICACQFTDRSGLDTVRICILVSLLCCQEVYSVLY